MPANDVLKVEDANVRQKPQQIASWKHLVGFLLIGVGVVALGFLGVRQRFVRNPHTAQLTD